MRHRRCRSRVEVAPAARRRATRTVARLLDAKGHDAWSIASGATVYDAIRLMAEKGVGAILVMDGSELVGIVSERDYARKVALQDRSSRNTLVRDIMTPDVISVRPDRSVEYCMELMTDRRIRHLPVVEDGDVVGIVSIGDLVKSTLAEKEREIEHLENYITGR